MHGKEEEPLDIGIKDFGLKKCEWVAVLEKEREEQQQHKRRDFTEAVRNSQRLLPSKQQKKIGKDQYYQVLEENQQRWEQRQVALLREREDHEDGSDEGERNPADVMFQTEVDVEMRKQMPQTSR